MPMSSEVWSSSNAQGWLGGKVILPSSASLNVFAGESMASGIRVLHASARAEARFPYGVRAYRVRRAYGAVRAHGGDHPRQEL